MGFIDFLFKGPSMKGSQYDVNSYINQDLSELKKTWPDFDKIKILPKNFDYMSQAGMYDAIDKKLWYLKYAFIIIPVVIPVCLWLSAKKLAVKIIITCLAITALGLYRSYQAQVQAAKWSSSKTKNEIEEIFNKFVPIYQDVCYRSSVKDFKSANTSMLNVDLIVLKEFFNDNLKNFKEYEKYGAPLIKGTEGMLQMYVQLQSEFAFFNKIPDFSSNKIRKDLENLRLKVTVFTAALEAKDQNLLKALESKNPKALELIDKSLLKDVVSEHFDTHERDEDYELTETCKTITFEDLSQIKLRYGMK